jgi:hypothetical protein
MSDGMNRGWRQHGRFAGQFGAYTVQGFKYLSDSGEVGWHTTSWPMRDPVHDFWVSGATFYKVSVYPAGEVSNRQRVEIFEVVEDVNPAEKNAVLEAIWAWETQLNSRTDRESPNKGTATGEQ